MFLNSEMKYELTKMILEGIVREDLYSRLDEINIGDKYDDSIASCYYAPAFLRMMLSHRPPPSVISHHTSISPSLERDTQNYYTHLFRTENDGGGVYGNLTTND